MSAAYDVVVVGGGIAGLSAAISACENGARVALLERSVEAETGGNTRYTEAYLRMKSLDEPSEGSPRRSSTTSWATRTPA